MTFLSKTEEKPVGLESKLWIPRDEKHGSSIEVLSAEWCKEIFTHTKKCMKKTLRRAVKSGGWRGERCQLGCHLIIWWTSWAIEKH